jgi:hypothetical protein
VVSADFNICDVMANYLVLLGVVTLLCARARLFLSSSLREEVKSNEEKSAFPGRLECLNNDGQNSVADIFNESSAGTVAFIGIGPIGIATDKPPNAFV